MLTKVKLPSEHADHFIPFLRNLQTDYGRSKGCVHDMRTGILKAVAVVFPGIRDFIRHFHFLRDIGKDSLESAYGELRKHLPSHATNSQLHALARDTHQCLLEQSSRCAMLAKPIKIEKYDDKLFADPLKVDTLNGPITIYPQRTNNILERFFLCHP